MVSSLHRRTEAYRHVSCRLSLPNEINVSLIVIGDKVTGDILPSSSSAEGASQGGIATKLNFTHQYIALLLIVFLQAGLVDVR